MPQDLNRPDEAQGQADASDAKRARKQWKRLAGRLSTLAGGAIAIWLGIALWAGLGWGLALAGMGIILLTEQLARRRVGLRYDLFWVIAGAIALIGGMLLANGVDIRFGPLILIAVGIFIVLSTLSGDRGKL